MSKIQAWAVCPHQRIALNLAAGQLFFLTWLGSTSMVRSVEAAVMLTGLKPQAQQLTLARGFEPKEQILANNSAETEATGEYSQLEPAILLEINKARTDPQAYAAWLETRKQYYDGILLKLPGEKSIRTNKGLKAKDEAIAFLQQLDPLSPLAQSTALSLAAAEKLQATITNEKPRDFWQENISYRRQTAEAIVMQLLVEDGFPDRRHRVNLFNPTFELTGVACQNHTSYQNICAITYQAAAIATTTTTTSDDNSQSYEVETLAPVEEETKASLIENQTKNAKNQMTEATDNGAPDIYKEEETPTQLAEAREIKPPRQNMSVVTVPTRLLEKIQRGRLEEGDTTIPNDGSLYDSYPIEGKAGESFIISVESDDFDTFLAIINDKGNIVAQNDDINDSNSNSRLRVTLPKDGVYNVIVNAYDRDGKGQYLLTVHR